MLTLAALVSIPACGPGGRSDLPVSSICGPEPVENPSCPTGTGLTAIGPEVSEDHFVSAVRVDDADVFIIVVEFGPSPPSIWRIPKNGDPPLQIPAGMDCPPNRLAIDRTFVYWSGYGCARRANRSGGEVQVLMGTYVGPFIGITSDGTSVFIAGPEIERVEEDGSLVALGHNEAVGDIFTDGSAIYGMTYGPDSSIAAFDLASRAWRRVTPEHMEGVTPNLTGTGPAIALDQDNVYWSSDEPQILARTPKHGGEVHRIINALYFTGIAAADGYVYWAQLGRLRRARCDGSDDLELFQDFDFRMGDLALDDAHVYFTTGEPGVRLMRVCR